VRVARITGEDGAYAWHVEAPRRVQPTPIKGSAALFYVPDTEIRYVTLTLPNDALQNDLRATMKRSLAARERATRHPYTFSIGDRALRGESAATSTAARKRAGELVSQHGTQITILRDGLAIGGEG
jgi:hypothetical protein